MTAQNPSGRHRRFYRSLGPADRFLICLRDELYDGSWTPMLRVLHERLKGRPRVAGLLGKMQQDIARIQRLHDYEVQHRIDLADYGDPPSPA